MLYIRLKVPSSLLVFITFLPVSSLGHCTINYSIWNYFIGTNQLYEIDVTMASSCSTSLEVSSEPWMRNTLLSAKPENLSCPESRSHHPSPSNRVAPHYPAVTHMILISEGPPDLSLSCSPSGPQNRGEVCAAAYHVWRSKQITKSRAGTDPKELSLALWTLPQCKTLQNTENLLSPIVFPSHKLQPLVLNSTSVHPGAWLFMQRSLCLKRERDTLRSVCSTSLVA